MATLEVWYNQRPGDDFAAGDPAVLVTAAEELDALMDRAVAENAPGPVWPVLEISLADDPYALTVEAGLGVERGFLHFTSATEDTWSQGNLAAAGEVTYQFCGQVREVPASVEVPVAQVRHALHQVLTTSTKPEGVAWQQPAGA